MNSWNSPARATPRPPVAGRRSPSAPSFRAASQRRKASGASSETGSSAGADPSAAGPSPSPSAAAPYVGEPARLQPFEIAQGVDGDAVGEPAIGEPERNGGVGPCVNGGAHRGERSPAQQHVGVAQQQHVVGFGRRLAGLVAERHRRRLPETPLRLEADQRQQIPHLRRSRRLRILRLHHQHPSHGQAVYPRPPLPGRGSIARRRPTHVSPGRLSCGRGAEGRGGRSPPRHDARSVSPTPPAGQAFR